MAINGTNEKNRQIQPSETAPSACDMAQCQWTFSFLSSLVLLVFSVSSFHFISLCSMFAIADFITAAKNYWLQLNCCCNFKLKKKKKKKHEIWKTKTNKQTNTKHLVSVSFVSVWTSSAPSYTVFDHVVETTYKVYGRERTTVTAVDTTSTLKITRRNGECLFIIRTATIMLACDRSENNMIKWFAVMCQEMRMHFYLLLCCLIRCIRVLVASSFWLSISKWTVHFSQSFSFLYEMHMFRCDVRSNVRVWMHELCARTFAVLLGGFRYTNECVQLLLVCDIENNDGKMGRNYRKHIMQKRQHVITLWEEKENEAKHVHWVSYQIRVASLHSSHALSNLAKNSNKSQAML